MGHLLAPSPLSPPSLLSPSLFELNRPNTGCGIWERPDLPAVMSRNLVARSLLRPSHVAYLSILPDSSSCIAEERSGGENVERDEDQRRPRRLEGGGEEFVGHVVFCPTWGRFSPSEERCTMLYRNSVVVLISSDLSPSLLLSPSGSVSCHLSKSEACIVFDLLSGGTFEPADTDAERLGRCRNLKAISQRQFRPSNCREVGKNERFVGR